MGEDSFGNTEIMKVIGPRSNIENWLRNEAGFDDEEELEEFLKDIIPVRK